tara:strand:- start:893 stop:3292 length:2400 start_codon:yes stop_codon:yes gene_type:complete
MWKGRLDVVAAAHNRTLIDAATLRVWCGELLEQHAAELHRSGSTKTNGARAQLYYDAYVAAVWTSAHATYAALAREHSANAPTSGADCLPLPSIATVECAATEYNTAYLYERTVHGAQHNSRSKESRAVDQLLARCTNPGFRGWSLSLQQAFETISGRDLVSRATIVCLTGMHPHLNPEHRPPWNVRLVATRHAWRFTSNKTVMVSCSMYLKEVVRRHLASVLSTIPAQHVALFHVKHPTRKLLSPPLQLPDVNMECAMCAFCKIGALFGTTPHANKPNLFKEIFESTFTGTWKTGWIGKGTATVLPHPRLLQVAGVVWKTAFKAVYIPYWINAAAHNMRLARMCNHQYVVMHKLSDATRLADSVDPNTALMLQRIAIQTPWIGMATVHETIALMNSNRVYDEVSIPSCNTPENAMRLLGSAGASTAAALLYISRVVASLEQLVVVQLSETTRARQQHALENRIATRTSNTIHAKTAPPLHLNHLTVCVGCRRVATSIVTTSAWSKPHSFIEYGIQSCQLKICSDNTRPLPCFQCAKRPSAALKSAEEAEKVIKKRRIEDQDTPHDVVHRVLYNQLVGNPGTATRIRRDCKTAYQQAPCSRPCSSLQMINIPLLGRAIRVFNSWYTLCASCAAPMHLVFGLTWYGSEPCCMRCSTDGTSQPTQALAQAQAQAVAPAPRCRFCGVTKPFASATGWKEVKSPHDVTSANATLPQALRTVHYCRVHYRNWIPQAHACLETRMILSHIAHNARPLFEVFEDQNAAAAAAAESSTSATAAPRRTSRTATTLSETSRRLLKRPTR